MLDKWQSQNAAPYVQSFLANVIFEMEKEARPRPKGSWRRWWCRALSIWYVRSSTNRVWGELYCLTLKPSPFVSVCGWGGGGVNFSPTIEGDAGNRNGGPLLPELRRSCGEVRVERGEVHEDTTSNNRGNPNEVTGCCCLGRRHLSMQPKRLPELGSGERTARNVSH